MAILAFLAAIMMLLVIALLVMAIIMRSLPCFLASGIPLIAALGLGLMIERMGPEQGTYSALLARCRSQGGVPIVTVGERANEWTCVRLEVIQMRSE